MSRPNKKSAVIYNGNETAETVKVSQAERKKLKEAFGGAPAAHELAHHLPALQSGARGKWDLLIFIGSQEAGTLLMQHYPGDTQTKDLMQTLDTLMHIWSEGRR